MPRSVTVMDTSTLIDLIDIGLLEAAIGLPTTHFVVPEEVRLEVSREPYRQRLEEAIEGGGIEPLRIEDPAEIALKEELARRFGQGEAACLAVAIRRGWWLACEERGRAFQREAERRGIAARVVRVEDLLHGLVDSGLMRPEEVLGALWEAEARCASRRLGAKAEHIGRIRERFEGRRR